MAIIVKEHEKKLDWFPLVVGAFIIVVLGSSAYFLFLSPAPLIEKIAPIQGLKSADEFNNLNDPTTIFSDPSFSALHLYVPNPETGQLGRDNPFLKLF